MKPKSLILTVVWAASLAGVYVLAKGQGVEAGKAEGLKLAQVSGVGSGGGVRPPGAKGTGAGGGAGVNAATAGKSVKEIMAKVKGMLRNGGMMNMSGAMKAMTLLGEIRDEDLQEAIKMAEETTEPQQKMMLFMSLLSRWAESDAPAAMKYAEEKLANQGPMMQMGKMGIVSTWAEKDPDAVWAWYKKQEAEGAGGGGGMFGGGKMALMGIFGSMAGRDLDSAFKKYGELETAEERNMALMGITQSAYDDASRKRVMEEIDKIKDGDERKQARQSLVGQWAMMEPEKAASYVEGLPVADRADIAQSVGSMMMMNDPKKGAEFILKNSDSSQPGQKYSTVIASWAHQDANAAGEWLGKQPQGPELDGARSIFATTVAGKDPESAMEWAKTITEENQRQAAVTGVYGTWKKKDAAAADAALARSGMPAQKVEEIRKGAGMGPTPTERPVPVEVK